MNDKMKNDRMFRFFVLLTLFMAASINITAQVDEYNSLPSDLSHFQNSVSIDTINSEIKAEKKYWLPAIEVIGLNFVVWGYHRYISGENWSDINWETIKNNLQYGFVWDSDGYLINQF